MSDRAGAGRIRVVLDVVGNFAAHVALTLCLASVVVWFVSASHSLAWAFLVAAASSAGMVAAMAVSAVLVDRHARRRIPQGRTVHRQQGGPDA